MFCTSVSSVSNVFFSNLKQTYNQKMHQITQFITSTVSDFPVMFSSSAYFDLQSDWEIPLKIALKIWLKLLRSLVVLG